MLREKIRQLLGKNRITREKILPVLGLLLALILFIVGLAWSTTAKADSTELAVCMTLDDYPTISGVVGVLNALIEEGYTPYRAGEIIGQTVRDHCPEHMGLILRAASAMS
jgi:hypothetical protein